MIIYLYTVIPGDAWGEQLHWLSKDIKRWCIIIGVLLSIFCLAQVCIHLWGSMKIFGKIFLNCYFRLISRVKTNYEIPSLFIFLVAIEKRKDSLTSSLFNCNNIKVNSIL
jgi:hypothetical protein